MQIERPRYSESNTKPFENMIDKLTRNIKGLYNIGANSYIGDISPHIDAINESLAFIEFINQVIAIVFYFKIPKRTLNHVFYFYYN